MSAERLRELLGEATPGPLYAVVNDLIGGWSVANVDKPMHAIDTRKGSPARVMADFATEADARLIALAPDAIALLADLADALMRPSIPDRERKGYLARLDALCGDER